MSVAGPFSDLGARSCEVRFTPMSRPRQLNRFRPKSADIVAKVENRTTQKISRKLTLGFSAAASLFSATTEIRDRFWMKRYGPSRRRA